MPTNNNINYGPQPLPGTTPAPVGPLDRGPAAVPQGTATGVYPPVVTPVVPVIEQPVVVPAIPPQQPIIPVVELPVDTTANANVAVGPNLTASNQQRYITILANGVVVTNNATTLNFTGNGVTVSNLGTTGANIVITAGNGGGGTNYSNSNVSAFLAAFGSNTISTTGNITGGNILGNVQAADGPGSVQFNVNGVLGAAAGFNYQSNTGTLFSKAITGTGDPVSGTGAIYGGLGSFTQLGSTVLGQFAGNVDSYAQLNLQNINSGGQASADYIITADNGTDSTRFIDLGMTSSGWDGSETNVLGNLVPNNGYLYVQDGNLTLGTRAGNVSYGWNFDTTGNLNLAGPLVGPADNQLALFSNTDIRLQAKIRGTGEPFNGGRLFLLGGQGSTGNANNGPTGGGYTRLYSGSGGAASAGNTYGAGSGGYMRVRAGNGGDASDVGPAGNGGYLQFRAGSGGYNQGNVDLGSSGGDVEITAGYSTGSFQNGGPISVNTGGADNGLPGAFEINIPIGANVPGLGNTPGGTWSFDGSGNVLNVPQNAQIYASNFGNITVGAAGNTFITSSDYIGNTYTWQFGSTGTLTFPNNSGCTWPVTQQRYGMGNIGAWLDGEWTIGEFSGNSVMGQVGIRIDPGIEGYTGMTFPGSLNSNTQPVYIYSTNGGGIQLNTGSNTWTFDSTGNLTTPGNIAVITPHGNIKIGDFSASTGPAVRSTSTFHIDVEVGNALQEWTFDTAGNLTAPGNIITSGSGGDIVMSDGNITGANNIVLANSITTTGSAGNITMTGGSINGVNIINLSSVVGNVTRPGYLTWVANSSGDGYNFTTMHLMPDSNVGGDAYLIIDPTYPNHLHVRAGGTQDNSGTQLFVGGENSNFRVDAGSNPAVYAMANSHQWQFGTDGNLTVPENIHGTDNGTPLVIDGAGSGYSYISIPTFQDGGEELVIRNSFGTSQGLRFQTESGNFTMIGNTFTGATANVELVAGAYSWTFDNNGGTTFPNGAKLNNSTSLQFATDNTVVTSLDLRDTGGAGFFTNGSGVTLRSNGTYNWLLNTNGNTTVPGNITGPASYNQPGFITPYGGDPFWSYGIYNSGANYWMQTRFYGQNQTTRGFRVLEAEGNTVVFSVNGVGNTVSSGGFYTNTGDITTGAGTLRGANLAITNSVTFTGPYGNANIDQSANFSTAGNVTANKVITNSNGLGVNIKVGDDIYLGDVNLSDTLGLRGQQSNGANAYIVFGNASNVKLGRAGTGPLTYEGNFSAQGNITAGNNFQLPVYANTTVRDSSISSPTPGMMIYVTGTGMQVRGATSWNTIAGSGT